MTEPIATLVVQDTDFLAAGLIQEGTVSWNEPLGANGAEVGVLRFRTRLNQPLPFVLEEEQYVEAADGDAVLRFAGRIKTVERVRGLGFDESQWDVEVQNWIAALDGIYMDGDFSIAAGDNDKNVVTQLVAALWGQLATVPGEAHRIFAAQHNLPEIALTQGSKTLRSALDAIAVASGSVYKVTPLKALRWNVYDQIAAIVLDDQNKTGDYRSYYNIRQRRDATSTVYRVTVVGAGGAIATVLDSVNYGAYARQRRYERGAPTLRIPTMADVTDTDLTTNDECTREGWRLLEEAALGETIEVALRDGAMVYPGELVYLVDSKGMPDDDFGWFDDEDLYAPGEPIRIDQALGLYLVRSVAPHALGGGKFEYAATLGDFRPTIERLQKAVT